ncbi:MAG: AmmeMemoRadiSam system protein B, partial [Acidimicrobiia bacterium]
MEVRLPVVAGTFYPANAQRLRSMVEGFLGDTPVRIGTHPRALIVPHAGYIYSGPIAASAYVTIHPEEVRRVVLVGPSHFVRLRGLAVPGVDALRTPLGDVPVHGADFPVVAPAHAHEHSL